MGLSRTVGRESETRPALGNWVRPDLCRNISAPLFPAARSSSRSRCWNAAGNSRPKTLITFGRYSRRPADADHLRSRPSLFCPITCIASGLCLPGMRIFPPDGMISKHDLQHKFPEGQGFQNAKGGMRFAFPPYGLPGIIVTCREWDLSVEWGNLRIWVEYGKFQDFDKFPVIAATCDQINHENLNSPSPAFAPFAIRSTHRGPD